MTFDAIFAFAALRFAKVPMLREFGLLLAVGVAAICLEQHRRHARDPRHPRVQVADEGPRLPRRPARPARRVARIAVADGAAVPLAVASLVVFAGGIAGRGQARAADRPDPVGQPEVAGDQGPRTCSTSETGSSSELGVFVQSNDVFDDKTVTFVDDFTRSQLAKYPETLLTASSIVETRQRPDRRARRAARRADRRRGAGRLRRRAAGHPAVDRVADGATR